MKHTPGPWVVAEYGPGMHVTTVAHCERFVIGLHSDIAGGNYRDGDPSGDPEADARLIAAAPEMLFALEQVAEAYESGGMLSAMAFVNVAIAKATGEAE